MSAINIQILSGPASGRVGTFDDSPISFGRSPDNKIVVDAVHASREHGELVRFDGAWHVCNHSANGTFVNGKPVGDEPHALKDGDVIGVGKEKLMRISLAPPPADEQAGEIDQAEETQAPQAKRPVNKLWLGIGIYLVVMMVVFLVLAMATGGNKDKIDETSIPMLSDEAIAAEIRKPLPKQVKDNERLIDEKIDKARAFYQQKESQIDALYYAHLNYKQALAIQGELMFDDGLVDRDFRACEELLIQRVKTTYRNAYAQRRSQQWSNAEANLYKLLQMYPDNRSQIHKNANLQLQQVLKKSKRRR